MILSNLGKYKMSDNLSENFIKLNYAIPLETWELNRMAEYLSGIINANPKRKFKVAEERLVQVNSALAHNATMSTN